MKLTLKWRGDTAWVYGTCPEGKRIRQSLRTKDKKRAEELRAAMENRIWRLQIYGPQAVMTFAEAAEHYVNDGGDGRFLGNIPADFANTTLAKIVPVMVRQAAKAAYPNHAGATVNRQAITPIRAVINFAHSQGWCSPIKVKGFPIVKPKKKAVDVDYLAKLRPELPPNLFALLLFLHTTGRRVGEAIALTPDDIRDGVAYISKTKNGDAAEATIVPVLADILADMPVKNGRVFGYTDHRNIYGALQNACNRAGVEYLGTHQVGRHSFATTLEREGWSTRAIADAGGWKSVRLVEETYIHTNNAAGRATDMIGTKMAQFFH